MKRNPYETLPKMTKGTVHIQRVRCGKPRCRCRRGESHVAYYLFWRVAGKLRKRYIPRADAPSVLASSMAVVNESVVNARDSRIGVIGMTLAWHPCGR